MGIRRSIEWWSVLSNLDDFFERLFSSCQLKSRKTTKSASNLLWLPSLDVNVSGTLSSSSGRLLKEGIGTSSSCGAGFNAESGLGYVHWCLLVLLMPSIAFETLVQQKFDSYS